MSEAAVVFKKRARGASQKKKRPADEAAEDDESVPVFKKVHPFPFLPSVHSF